VPIEEANGLKFHTQHLTGGQPSDDGDGGERTKRPQVVMLHGLVIDNLSSWYYTLANPVAMVADVHLVDLRGHGRSEMPKTGYTVEDNVDDLVALLDLWGITEPVHLFGNSFGGVVSNAWAGVLRFESAFADIDEAEAFQKSVSTIVSENPSVQHSSSYQWSPHGPML